jgi:hypothetical protein
MEGDEHAILCPVPQFYLKQGSDGGLGWKSPIVSVRMRRRHT